MATRKKTPPADQDTRLIVRVHNKTHTLNVDQLNHIEEMALFNQSGLTVARILVQFSQRDAPPFMVAAIVFLARMQAGETGVSFDEIASGIGQFTPVQWFPDEPGEEDPKAQEES